jgi:pimeloyl-ACP methyl ester carboxylesterase
MVQDGVELAEALRKSLRKDKIILVGHSWGSILGVFMVKARPELFYAFVGTGQVADPATTCAVAYDKLLKKAEALGEERAIRQSPRSLVDHALHASGHGRGRRGRDRRVVATAAGENNRWQDPPGRSDQRAGSVRGRAFSPC